MGNEQTSTQNIKLLRGRGRRAARNDKDQKFELEARQQELAQIQVRIDSTALIEKTSAGEITMDMCELERLLELLRNQIPPIKASEINSRKITFGATQTTATIILEASSKSSLENRLEAVHDAVVKKAEVVMEATTNIEQFATADHDSEKAREIEAALKKEQKISKVTAGQAVRSEVVIAEKPSVKLDVGSLRKEEAEARLRILASNSTNTHQTYTVRVTKVCGDGFFFAVPEFEATEHRYKLQSGLEAVVVGEDVQIIVAPEKKREIEFYQLVLGITSVR